MAAAKTTKTTDKQRRLSARETAVQIAMLLMGMAVVTLVSGLAHGGH